MGLLDPALKLSIHEWLPRDLSTVCSNLGATLEPESGYAIRNRGLYCIVSGRSTLIQYFDRFDSISRITYAFFFEIKHAILPSNLRDDFDAAIEMPKILRIARKAPKLWNGISILRSVRVNNIHGN